MSGAGPREEEAQALLLQKDQLEKAGGQTGKILPAVQALERHQAIVDAGLDELLAGAERLLAQRERGACAMGEEVTWVPPPEPTALPGLLPMLASVEVSADIDWQAYLSQMEVYRHNQGLARSEDPFSALMSATQRIELKERIRDEFSLKGADCDAIDYMVAGSCGLLAGLVDVFLVGLPGEKGGKLTRFADDATNGVVRRFASWCGWKGAAKSTSDPTKSAIGFLEGMFKVNYDHRHGGDVGNAFRMSTGNHHIKSLAHSPDLVGLFFSILDQFTNSAHFVSDGKIIRIDTEAFELSGSDFPSKLFAGAFNWFGHVMSDVAGSSGAVGRGSGLPMPFFSLLQFIDVGQFGQHRQTFATVAVKVFEQGYDARHGLALSIPMLVAELLTRLLWLVKRRFYHALPWPECLPKGSDPNLRRMLLVAHGTLCTVDAGDAALRSGGNVVAFLLRSNLVAWVRFGALGVVELKALVMEGSMDTGAVDAYLDAEYRRLMRSAMHLGAL
jgi:hypothetical protein